MVINKIDIKIEELILDGFDYDDRLKISTAIENELAKLFSENGFPHNNEAKTKGYAKSYVDAGSFNVKSDVKLSSSSNNNNNNLNPQIIGSKVAKSIYQIL